MAITELAAHAVTDLDGEPRAMLLAADDYSAVSRRVPVSNLYERGRSLGITQSLAWHDAVFADGRYKDVSRLYEFPCGRQVVLPLARRRRRPAWTTMTPHWGQSRPGSPLAAFKEKLGATTHPATHCALSAFRFRRSPAPHEMRPRR